MQRNSSSNKRKDESFDPKSTEMKEKLELIRKKTKTKLKSSSIQNQDFSSDPDDDSPEMNIKKKTTLKKQHKPSFTKQKDESIKHKSHRKSKLVKKTRNSSDNSNTLLDLSTETIDKLIAKKVQLGKGATSTAYKVKNIFTNDGFLCLKILYDEYFKRPNQEEENNEINWNDDDDDFNESENTAEIDIDKIRQLLKEYEILNQINHPNIVTVYSLYRGDPKHNPAILLEYCKFNLEQVASKIEDFYRVSIIYEICLAMDHVHQNKLIHRDLTIRNILINSEKHVKICDFGIAKVIDVQTLTSLSHGIGTLAFMAPEIIKDEVTYTEKVDVYSFGVVMYFIMTKGQMPKFDGVGNYINLEMSSIINKLSQKIIKACWSIQPEKRPSFKTLIEKIVKKNFLLIDGIEEEIPLLKKHLGLD